ncbi:hypothetical protein YC2023_104155 [Brassica napus]
MVPGLLSVSSFLCFTLIKHSSLVDFHNVGCYSYMDYASPWLNVQSCQNTLNMCFALLNYPGSLDAFLESEVFSHGSSNLCVAPRSRFQNTIKNENMEVGITLFVLYYKRKEDIFFEQLIIIGINLVPLLKDLRNDDRHAFKFCSYLVLRAGLAFFDRFFYIDRAERAYKYEKISDDGFISALRSALFVSSTCKHIKADESGLGNHIKVDPKLKFENPKLLEAYIALQSWKQTIFSDPFNFTANWNGSDVCSYNGIYCAPSPNSHPKTRVVAGIDLNHADMAGYLPSELGLLSDLALFHLNSNRFCGEVPLTFNRMKLLHELDLSNNRFVGKFPSVVLSLPSLKFLDLRFNDFEGKLPSKLFDRKLDAIFLNHNRFRFGIPDNMGNSPVSALVLADNDLRGCIPGSIGQMGKTLNELILSNDNLTGCLPPQIGNLKNVTVFDISSNTLRGVLPSSIGNMKSLEELHVANNGFSGLIPPSICQLPNLENFTYASNFFTGRAPICAALSVTDAIVNGSMNCIAGMASQRSVKECLSLLARPVDCSTFGCFNIFSPPPPTFKMAPAVRMLPPPIYVYTSPPPPSSKMSPTVRAYPPPSPSPSPPPPYVYSSPPPPPYVYSSPPLPPPPSPPPPCPESSPPPPVVFYAPVTQNPPPPPPVYYAPKTQSPPPPSPVYYPSETQTPPPPSYPDTTLPPIPSVSYASPPYY